MTLQFDEKNLKIKPVGFPDGFGFDQPYKISPWKIWQLLILINLQEFSWDSRGDKNGLENHLKKSGKFSHRNFSKVWKWWNERLKLTVEVWIRLKQQVVEDDFSTFWYPFFRFV